MVEVNICVVGVGQDAMAGTDDQFYLTQPVGGPIVNSSAFSGHGRRSRIGVAGERS